MLLCVRLLQKKSTTTKIGEFFKLPSFRRKNKSKLSPSAQPTISETGCDVTSYPVGEVPRVRFLDVVE